MPTLGLRGTGNFTVTGQRPENWREMILHLFPNGEAPFTAFLSMLASEPSSDPIYHWFEKDVPSQRLFINNGLLLSTSTFLTVDDGAGTGLANICKRGTVLMVERTNERLLVTQDPASLTEITVTRAFGTTAAAALNNNDALLIIGTAYEQGASFPTPVSYDPEEKRNYCQIFRTPLALTRTAKKTRLRTGDAYVEAKRECLQLHSIQLERAFLFGQLKASTINGQLVYTTKGVTEWISTNVWTVAGNITETVWDGYLEQIFRYGSPEKLCLCGSTFLNALNGLVKNKTTINVVPGNEVYGMKLMEYITPFGVLYLKLHPLFTIHPVHRKDGVIIDTSNVKERYVDNTQFLKHRQNPGDDAEKDEFLSETGLEIWHEKTHSWIKDIQGWA